MQVRNQTTLYFIRHGQTISNKKHIRQGVQIDDYLDTQGVLQAEKISKLIDQLSLDILFTSYLFRAEETAALINQNLKSQVPVLHDYRLRERDFGSLSGKPMSEWDQLLPDHAEKENLQTYDYKAFGGENVDEVRRRVFGALLDIVTNYDHENIGIITHGGVIRLLLFHFPEILRLYHEIPMEGEKDIANTDIYQWEITEGKIANIKSLLK